jgi:hypothetical protein
MSSFAHCPSRRLSPERQTVNISQRLQIPNQDTHFLRNTALPSYRSRRSHQHQVLSRLHKVVDTQTAALRAILQVQPAQKQVILQLEFFRNELIIEGPS